MSYGLPARIVGFQRCYQDAAKSLVLNGLAERWGGLNENLNTDLNDIAGVYANGHFLLAFCENEVVGTGALIHEAKGVMRVVRMSTGASMRHRGIGSQILNELIRIARSSGCHQVVLETTSTWNDAVQFYLNRGFRIVDEREGDTHFVLDLTC